MNKKVLGTVIIILIVIAIAYFAINRQHPETTKEIAECIGKNSVLYIQLGCHFCKVQEDMFGENFQYLTKVDCYFEPDKCSKITNMPTWEIKGEKYVGVQSISALQDLTGCK